VSKLIARGTDFLTIPDTYYDNLRKGLANAGIKV
jgi:4-hydroxyphenylpyruvate dioxygenase-like putative hemolysin